MGELRSSTCDSQTELRRAGGGEGHTCRRDHSMQGAVVARVMPLSRLKSPSHNLQTCTNITCIVESGHAVALLPELRVFDFNLITLLGSPTEYFMQANVSRLAARFPFALCGLLR